MKPLAVTGVESNPSIGSDAAAPGVVPAAGPRAAWRDWLPILAGMGGSALLVACTLGLIVVLSAG